MSSEEQCPFCDEITEVDSYRGGMCSGEDCEHWVLPCGDCPAINNCGFNSVTGECNMFKRDCINDMVPRHTEIEFKFMLEGGR